MNETAVFLGVFCCRLDGIEPRRTDVLIIDHQQHVLSIILATLGNRISHLPLIVTSCGVVWSLVLLYLFKTGEARKKFLEVSDVSNRP